jgi:hypothetical protein
MSPVSALSLVLAATCSPGHAANVEVHPHSLLQTWDEASGEATPIARVVSLLKEMSATIAKEGDEDEALRDKLKCWCNDNNWEKGNAVEASKAKISELEADIKAGTARSAELNQQIKDLNAEVAADKTALAEATALREKQLKEFHGAEVDSIQAVENLKAALTVLSKHHDGTPAAWGQGEDSTGKPSDSWAFLQQAVHAKDEPWTMEHETSHQSQALDEFMSRNGFGAQAEAVEPEGSQKFLQQGNTAAISASSSTWSAEETAVVRKALKSAASFIQAHHTDEYVPSYNAQSGEIVGVLKQLKEEMEGDLSESQKLESERAASFTELRAAKTSEIENGEKMSEQKEDELANTDNDLAEAKEDLGQEQVVLAETEKFLAAMGANCAEAEKNYQARQQARADESKAVAETIEILMSDEARDNFSETYSFLQISVGSQQKQTRKQVADKLRKAAAKAQDPALSMLASNVELDAFGKVKKAIDDMIAILNTQQAEEVKKSDWCKSTIQENEMTNAKTEDHKGDLEAKENQLEQTIIALAKRVQEATGEIAELRVNMQRASEDRKAENQEFQKTVSDQTITVEVLKKALDKLANYYDSFVQTKRQTLDPTPPVVQEVYTASKGAEGVMQMIEKLVGEAQQMTKDARKAEGEAQVAYEQFVADTNDSVAGLQKEVVTKTKNKAQATKEHQQTGADIIDTVKELEGLSKYNGELHQECDYVLKNFDVRQTARAEEVEALQQAKQILSGANLA